MVERDMRKQETQVFYEADEKAVWIAKCAWKAMLEEVYTTPKPGLVDFYSNGAHKDMNVHTFEKSARAIYPYFVRMVLQGYRLRCTPEMLFREIRKTGQIAEQMMYRATGGVNTHKGLIFTMGIFCGAAGRCLGEGKILSKEYLSQMQKEMTTRILLEELAECAGKESEEFLKDGGAYQTDAIEKLQKMDADFINRNISAGGCADLLAASIFIHMLLQVEW